jgi:general secretion pathway protein F
MAVFEYRGLLVASGKTVHDVRDADNPKALRAMLKREGILLTEANEVNRAKNASSSGASP